jgi:hypothetical protein
VTPITLEQVLARIGEVLRADANHQLTVIEHERRVLKKSSPNTWLEPFARALLAERGHIMQLRGEVAGIHPAAPGTADVLVVLDATASGLLALFAALTTSDLKSAALLVADSQRAFARARAASAAAAREVR